METYGLEQLGIISPSAVYRNLSPAILVEKALARGEGKLNSTGALCVNTGKYTGRSPNDKFIVDSAGVHDEIAWGKVNVPTTQEAVSYTHLRAARSVFRMSPGPVPPPHPVRDHGRPGKCGDRSRRHPED